MSIKENYDTVLLGCEQILKNLGFEKISDTAEENEEIITRFSGEKGNLALSYLDGRIGLYFGDDEDPMNTPTRLTASLLKEKSDSRDIKYVINDITDTLNEKFQKKIPAKKKAQNQKANQTVSKTAVKNGSFYDPNTLASKLCLVFPEMRDEYKEHLAKNGEFYSEEFFDNIGTEKVISAIKANNPATMKRLFQTLNEIYEDGSNETQSLIAVTILGKLDNNQILLANCVDYMSETMAPTVIEVNRYLASFAGKKAKKLMENPPAYKPKKKKKQSAFMQAMSEGMAQTPIQ